MSLLHEKQVRVLKLFERLSVAASGEKIPADQIDARLSTVGELPNSAFFSCFLPAHLEEAKRLIEIFYSAKDFDDFVLLAEQARTFVNSTLFAFAAEVAILHRADSRGIIVPPIQEIFADRFVPADTLIRAFSVATTKPAGDESDVIIDVQETGNILDPEYKLAYYREDIGVNAHHWHWHVVYPSVYDSKFFGKKKDRTGELFYYMHQQMCASFLPPYQKPSLSKNTKGLPTFNREDELELTHCMNFGSPGSVKARYHHLDHESFSYIINANNNGSEEKKGTVRIFLAPKYDELGNVISLDEQRRLYIEMDKFDTDLRPGKNIIVRSSTDSTVTISSTYTFKELLHGEDLEEDRSEFCSCGWPQHLLVPKGSNKGMVFDLFVMITDAEKDKVPTSGKKLCNDALSYCGVMDEKYPDKRAMGYPFDRTITAQSHEEFITPNMKISNITVRFQD
ncbi:hemocyanin A chain [Trichonephila inaurata madagascariensis]|uniref:Hemocyanin A chain n=1 Tax=Trichonephila inaurata madagascariensis TaxID=2747483 RepID=A0A8X6YA83_9ARAC|nr:hemocyanin A chain [Trichonephila inaurata madagascariensis]